MGGGCQPWAASLKLSARDNCRRVASCELAQASWIHPARVQNWTPHPLGFTHSERATRLKGARVHHDHNGRPVIPWFSWCFVSAAALAALRDVVAGARHHGTPFNPTTCEAPDGPDHSSIEVRMVAFFATTENEAAREEGRLPRGYTSRQSTTW